ncbi:OmpA family protein [Altererythrobacter sp. B11]|uniref:OmpA family protein n=1 Tax=Altererythrobacter sp. B11 TaxID=2060312 RepID=UPI000DC6F97B|nr:OmpA family protein [Altererythrobacter sp. B11]BBC72845.1 OmpA family protein [Altererythrobacter sp. B11]
MRNISGRPIFLCGAALIAVGAAGSLSAQQLEPVQDTAQRASDAAASEDSINVYGEVPTDLSGLPAGPEIEGILSARKGNSIQVTDGDGANSMISLSEATQITGKGGFLGLGRTDLAADSLLNGLPVAVETVQWEGGLVASKVKFKKDDLEVAEMIHGGTSQRFAEHDVAIEKNAAATEALRGRMGDIDKYNLKGTTNVYFDTGKWNLSPAARTELCAAAQDAAAMDNALLLVVGYTDSVGDQDYNQTLSEKRAGRVVNFLQQECRWAPYRMLTPTGMAEADPTADNTTAAGRAQNRRVSVNILVSKAVDES